MNARNERRTPAALEIIRRARRARWMAFLAVLMLCLSAPMSAAARGASGHHRRMPSHNHRASGKHSRRAARSGLCAHRSHKHPHARTRRCRHREMPAVPAVVGQAPMALPAPPPAPSAQPLIAAGYHEPTALIGSPAPGVGSAVPSGAPHAVTWGARAAAKGARAKAASAGASTLVLYDTTNTWGWLGELYAIGAGNLASHFGTVTAEPVVDYQPGQVNSYTATIYIGSTYNEPIPTAFLDDVLSTSHPVIWAGWNIWQLSGSAGSAADQAFQSKYGWDPSASWIDGADNPLTVSYKGQTFTRNALSGPNVLAPKLTDPSAVEVLARANCGAPSAAAECGALAQSAGSSFPWAIRSSNITYVGEVPFSYISESDRYVAFSDLLFAALDPTATPSHQALVRLEDVSAASNPAQLKRFADYLHKAKVPFSVNVIPKYTDPYGYYDEGKPQTITLDQAPKLVSALKYMQSKGGTLIEEGYTHQYSNVENPYSAASGDDAEFFRAQCSTTPTPPYSWDSECQPTDTVIWTGPLPGDSGSWAGERVKAGQHLFEAAGLGVPKLWVTPHYFASAADYEAIDKLVPARYERDVFPGGLLSGGSLDYGHLFGQFFPYSVTDTYGEPVVPENLGDYEPTPINNNPVRCVQDVIDNAKVNLAVTQGVASFFFYDASETPKSSPCYSGKSNPLDYLRQIVEGIKKLGYTFVSPSEAIGG